MKRSDKKGSHVGMILSFSLFIVFIFFLYFIFEPSLKSSDEKKIVLESVETKLFEKIETDFVEIIVTNTSSVDCVRINNIFDDTFYVIAKDAKGSIVQYNLSGSFIYVNWNSGLNRIKLYGASNLSDKSSDVVDTASCIGGAKIESINRQGYISVLELEKVANEYNSNEGYDKLRNELGINFDYEFEFRFEDINGNFINATQDYVPNMIDVYARTIPVIYFDEEASVFAGSLYLRVW